MVPGTVDTLIWLLTWRCPFVGRGLLLTLTLDFVLSKLEGKCVAGRSEPLMLDRLLALLSVERLDCFEWVLMIFLRPPKLLLETLLKPLLLGTLLLEKLLLFGTLVLLLLF